MNSAQDMEKALKIIKEIENKTLELKNKDKITKIEMDILLERVRMLYDNLIQTDKNYEYSQSPGTEITAKPVSQPSEEETRFQEPDNEINEQQKQEQEQEKEREREKEPEHKTTTEPAPTEENKKAEYQEEKKVTRQEEEIQENQPEEKTHTGEKSKTKTYGPEIVADKYHNTVTFRHENLAKNQAKTDVSSKMQNKPIRDLTKAIGVNDKFLFIRELFDGDRDSYHEAIQILNEIPNYEEAESYISERFDWDWEQPEVKKFLELIQRKFS